MVNKGEGGETLGCRVRSWRASWRGEKLGFYCKWNEKPLEHSDLGSARSKFVSTRLNEFFSLQRDFFSWSCLYLQQARCPEIWNQVVERDTETPSHFPVWSWVARLPSPDLIFSICPWNRTSVLRDSGEPLSSLRFLVTPQGSPCCNLSVVLVP